jgi:hypothetical protein
MNAHSLHRLLQHANLLCVHQASGNSAQRCNVPFPLCSRNVTVPNCVKFDTVSLRSVLRLLVTATVVPSPPILVTLMIEAMCSSETSVLTRDTAFFFREQNYSEEIATTSRLLLLG